MKQYLIKFEYADALSGWQPREQKCALYAENATEARYKCIELYGLGIDCNYLIMEVKEINE